METLMSVLAAIGKAFFMAGLATYILSESFYKAKRFLKFLGVLSMILGISLWIMEFAGMWILGILLVILIMRRIYQHPGMRRLLLSKSKKDSIAGVLAVEWIKKNNPEYADLLPYAGVFMRKENFLIWKVKIPLAYNGEWYMLWFEVNIFTAEVSFLKRTRVNKNELLGRLK